MADLCLIRANCPKGMGHMLVELGLIVYGLCECPDSLEPFFRQITVPCREWLEAKCEKLTVILFLELNDMT